MGLFSKIKKKLVHDDSHPYLTEYFDKYLHLTEDLIRQSQSQTEADPGYVCLIQSNEARMKTVLQPLAEKAFDHHDLDHNGVLSVDESKYFFSHIVREWKKFALGKVRFVCAQYYNKALQDYKKSGKDDPKFLSDLQTVMASTQTFVDELVDETYANYLANEKAYDKAAFAVVDVNRDGSLRREEVLDALDVTSPKFMEFFKAFGIDIGKMTEKAQAKLDSCMTKLSQN